MVRRLPLVSAGVVLTLTGTLWAQPRDDRSPQNAPAPEVPGEGTGTCPLCGETSAEPEEEAPPELAAAREDGAQPDADEDGAARPSDWWLRWGTGEGLPAVPLADGGGREPYEWFLIPLAGYSSDIGFAGALLGMLFHYDPGYEPFRDKVQLIALVTTKLVQFYELVYERVGLFGKPLRLETALSFTATEVGHYCGLGNEVSCNPALAREAAAMQGLAPGDDGYRRFVANYYRFRVMRPAARLGLRWRPTQSAPEVTLTWEGNYGISGYVGARGPFPGSLYARDYPDGEEGFLSELRLGVVADRRDHERRPSHGYVLAATLRGAGRAVGSEWTYAGLSLVAAGYLPLTKNRRLVLATRAIADLLVGDPPTTIMGSLGGFWNDIAFGGQTIGRGIRARRYLGRIKVIGQAELRWAFFGRDGEFQGLLGVFGDVGWIGVDYDDWGGDVARVLPSFGALVGVYWGQAFLLRFDVGLSALEDYRPQFYLSVRHPF